MAGSVNRVILIGNLGKDPEVFDGRSGKVVKFSVATSESWRDKETGERKEVTDWHNVVVFEKHASEFAQKYLKKGHKVYVEGRQKTRKYDKDGQTHYATDVVIANFGGSLVSLQPSSGEGRGNSPDDYGTPNEGSDRPSRNTSHRRDAAANSDLDDDIPF